MKILWLAGCLALAPSIALGDEIKVLSSGGAVETTNNAPAIVTFQASEKIVVRQVDAEMAAATTSNSGYSATTFGDVSHALCVTPCTLELRPGFIRIRFGDANPMNANRPIDFNLHSGDNTYRIEPFKHGKFATGFILTIIGGSAAIVGTAAGIVQSDIRVPMLVMAGAGIGVTIGGIVLIAGSRASAELVPTHDPSIR